MQWHPHLHILLTDGGWLPDGTFRHFLYFDTHHLEELFRAEVLHMLQDKGLIDQSVVTNMLAWPNSGFSAHASTRAENRNAAAKLGRYMIRCPVVLERMSFDEKIGEILYRARPSRAQGPFGGTKRFDILEFIARVTDHIPERGQQLLRYWGAYANASLQRRRRAATQSPSDSSNPDQETTSEFVRQRRLSWAQLIRRVFEVDPLICPFCGQEMEILSFITEFATTRRFLDSLDLPPQEPEPLAHSPPAHQELLYEPV